MNIPRYAAAAANLLRRHVPSAASPAGDRARGTLTIDRALRAKARRRLLRGATLLAAAAALVALAPALRSLISPHVSDSSPTISASASGGDTVLRVRDGVHPLVGVAELEAGQSIDTAKGGAASLSLSTGTSLQLGGTSSLRVDERGAMQRFSLERGDLSAHVAKLRPGQRFVVATPDAEVEVRGTRFVVRVLARGEACGGGSRTRLEVSEGRVEVRAAGRTNVIGTGSRWPLDCAPPSEAEPEQPQHNELKSPAGGAAPTKSSAPARAGHALERPSALTQQNDLFAEGVALRRQGDVSGALRVYQDLIARFPASPLAENAMVERMRLLSARNTARASDEARAYLARYPRGFAVKEARQLTAAP